MNNITKEYGYIRVSSKTQNVARQIKMMKERGIPDKRIYIEKGDKRLWRKKKESRRAAQAALIGKVGIVPLPETV